MPAEHWVGVPRVQLPTARSCSKSWQLWGLWLPCYQQPLSECMQAHKSQWGATGNMQQYQTWCCCVSGGGGGTFIPSCLHPCCLEPRGCAGQRSHAKRICRFEALHVLGAVGALRGLLCSCCSCMRAGTSWRACSCLAARCWRASRVPYPASASCAHRCARPIQLCPPCQPAF